ncbi:MAG: hypothetical protein CMJ18_25225 [Phycisphaeraceae bacterium]|nr:hypothetical protein [Phycisphaeraceae bacterium]
MPASDASRATGRIVAALLLLLHIVTSAGAESGDRLLSRNATYTVIGGGWVYAGQIQPGVNARATKAGIVHGPLVEPTDDGDELIDGDTSDRSIVHTTWTWQQPGKVIDITMTLPGESTVRRVKVTYPQDTNYRPELTNLKTRVDGGEWASRGRRFVHQARDPVEESPTSSTFEFDGIRCRELNFYIGGAHLRVGVTEIEVWGEGPTENARRGLIRAKPHVSTVEVPTTRHPDAARNLAKSAKIEIEASYPVTGGTAEALIDGDRREGVRIGPNHQKHLELTAELDLGDTYRIDAVYLWMPGGRGVETGHLHEMTLSVSPSADHLDWVSPVDPIAPAYWPTDDAPKPYVVPVAGLDAPGRRVRVTGYLSGTGGVTSLMSIGEIEVWGRPLDVPVDDAPRLELRPLKLDPVPLGTLSPKWQAMRERRIRGIWIAGDLDDRFGDSAQTKAAVLADVGFNTVVLYTGVDPKNRSESPALAPRMERNLAEAAKHGLALLAKWQFGSTHQEPYRKFRGPNGVEHERSACPLQPDYIERHVGRWAVRCAELGADGFTFDTEMYESDSTRYPGACYCDSCFRRYVKAYSTDWKHHFEHVRPERRGLWIAGNEAGDHYRLEQRLALIKQFGSIRDRCRAINPDYLFAYAPFVGYMSGLTLGLATTERPVIVWSEREYTHGPESRTIGYLERMRDEQLPALYVCGHMIWYQDPKMLADNLVVGALHTDGWWAWLGTAILAYVGTDEPIAYKSPYGRADGTTARDYLDAIKAAHARLDRLLGEDPETWPRAEMFRGVRGDR